jgi:hypothetical protein
MFASARTFARAVNITAAPRSSVTTTTRAAAGDVWMPGSARPKYLDGSAPGYVCVCSFASFVFFFWFVTRRGSMGFGRPSRLFATPGSIESNRIDSILRSYDDDDGDGDDGCSFGCASSVRPSVRVSAYPRTRPTKTRQSRGRLEINPRYAPDSVFEIAFTHLWVNSMKSWGTPLERVDGFAQCLGETRD